MTFISKILFTLTIFTFTAFAPFSTFAEESTIPRQKLIALDPPKIIKAKYEWLINNVQNPVRELWKPKLQELHGQQTTSSFTIILFVVDSAGNVEETTVVYNDAIDKILNSVLEAISELDIRNKPPTLYDEDLLIEFTFKYNVIKDKGIYNKITKTTEVSTNFIGEKVKNSSGFKENSLEFYKKLADSGNLSAAYTLGFYYALGKDITSKNYELAFKYYSQAANTPAPLPNVLNDLAYFYFTGKGTKQDLPKAFELYSKAAGMGNQVAQINLGRMYYYGEYVKKDLNKAYDLYLKAKNSGLEGVKFLEDEIKIVEKELF